MISRNNVRKIPHDSAEKLPVLAESPAKIAAKVREGGAVIADALEQAKKAALVLASWQGELSQPPLIKMRGLPWRGQGKLVD